MTDQDKLLRDLTFLHWLMVENGYSHARPIGGNRYACVSPFLHTAGIIVGEMGDEYGIVDRWCYHNTAAAVAAIEAWDGVGEPVGWHRQPFTGRRLAETDDHIDETGTTVPLGDIYVRR